ncbi:Origin recognition complex subunit 2 [Cryptotrichosporon argae]
MPPRPAKRARHDSASASPPAADPAAASDLISFLTAYDDTAASGSSSEGGGDAEADADSDCRASSDPDDDGPSTPSRKRGLVGTATPSSTKSRRTPSKRKTPASTPRRRAADKEQHQDTEDAGIIRSSRADAYFALHARGARTSGASYASLARPLTQAQYDAYASGARGRRPGVARRLAGAAARAAQYVTELEAGFNLLLYGYGSKRRLANALVPALSARGHVVVVNGHFPQLTIRDVVGQVEDALAVPQAIPAPPALAPLDRAVHRIYSFFLPPAAIKPAQRQTYPTADAPLFLVLHNIDAPALRKPAAQAVLALLSSSPRIHLVATFDHLSTPLLFSSSLSHAAPHAFAPGAWDGTVPASRGFNWIYHATPTYDDYDVELKYQRLSASSALSSLAAAGGISEEGALQILRSVPPMALRLLKLLLMRQLAALPADAAGHAAQPAAPTAPPFAADADLLQTAAREKFIAREEERFNALIGEFKDHGLVVQAELDADGRTGRWVWVPLGKAAVERVLAEMKEIEV